MNENLKIEDVEIIDDDIIPATEIPEQHVETNKYSEETMSLIKDWRHLYSKCPAIRKKWQKQMKESLMRDRLKRDNGEFILEKLNEQ